MDGRELLTMRWQDGLFAHWPADPELVDARLPDGLHAATYDGDAWLSVVAFVMEDIKPRGSPVGFSFPELNLRTYVRPDDDIDAEGRGVYFFNLDADDTTSVAVARRLFALPYYRAEMRATREDDGSVRFVSRRRDPEDPPARFDATYRPSGEQFVAEPGSLDAFLVENYRFYTDGRELYRGDIDHDPWRLQSASVTIRDNGLFEANDFDQPPGDPVVHYADTLDVTAGRIRRVRR
ncbi:hypothetical protein AUR64_10775 [Haloprofundus marisrubri]|uniref:DUF2071 domain-containing protein n=1 Tax=Haloprofundus marisrubri TaxID=1514971 RepID=A0A0W1R9S0_9EURY|nr:DUF2071 domain-containing protein [Haloprofundus marisrubri]KTG10075.1 hypothetical protein AUR64_10775 [Haloprofundus marisrubri]